MGSGVTKMYLPPRRTHSQALSSRVWRFHPSLGLRTSSWSDIAFSSSSRAWSGRREWVSLMIRKFFMLSLLFINLHKFFHHTIDKIIEVFVFVIRHVYQDAASVHVLDDR